MKKKYLYKGSRSAQIFYLLKTVGYLDLAIKDGLDHM